jgi:hypothetical protein
MPSPNFQSNFLTNQFVPDNTGRVLCTEESNKASFRAVAVTQTFYSTAAAVLFEMCGSATTTVRVKKILMWGNCATKFYCELTLGRATAQSSSYASITSMTPGKHDKNLAASGIAAGGLGTYQVAAPSGTGYTAFDGRILGITPPSATMWAQPCEWDWCLNNDGPMILRGTGDVLEIYNNTTGLGAGTFGCMVEWEEDNS